MTLVRHHFVQRLREEGLRHKVGVVDESGQCGVLGGGTARREVHSGEVLHFVALVHPLVADQSVVSIAGFHLLQLEEVSLGLDIQPAVDIGGEFFAFLAKLGIVHHAGLRLELKMALAAPYERMRDGRVCGEEGLQILRLVRIGEFLSDSLGHLKGAIVDALFRNRQNLLIVPLKDRFNFLLALYVAEMPGTGDDQRRGGQDDCQHQQQHARPFGPASNLQLQHS